MGSHHPIRKTVAPEPVAIPDKLYFRIGDVARLCQVPAYVLRFWETEFPSLKPNKGGTGQRLYRRKDVEIALRIKGLLYDQGYTIPGARQVFKAEASLREEKTREIEAAGPAGLASAPGAVLEETRLGPSASQFATQSASAPETLPDPGEAIRRQARLRALRDDLQALLAQLGGRAAPSPAAAPQPAPTPAKPPRPRLVLEPKPESRPEPKPLAAKREPHLHLAQGDLFPAE